MSHGGRAVVLALGLGVAAAVVAAAVYPVYIASERPAQAGERIKSDHALQKKSTPFDWALRSLSC